MKMIRTIQLQHCAVDRLMNTIAHNTLDKALVDKWRVYSSVVTLLPPSTASASAAVTAPKNDARYLFRSIIIGLQQRIVHGVRSFNTQCSHLSYTVVSPAHVKYSERHNYYCRSAQPPQACLMDTQRVPFTRNDKHVHKYSLTEVASDNGSACSRYLWKWIAVPARWTSRSRERSLVYTVKST